MSHQSKSKSKSKSKSRSKSSSKPKKNHFWLVKLPTYVAKEWFDPNRGQDIVGTIQLNDGSDVSNNGFPKMTMFSHNRDRSKPNEFNLAVRQPLKNWGTSGSMCKKKVFFTSPEEKKEDRCKLESLVELTADARPVHNAQWTRHMREKLYQATHERDSTQHLPESPLGMPEGTVALGGQSRFGGKRSRGMSPPRAPLAKKPKTKPRDKYTRLPKKTLKSAIFKLYDMQTHYTLKELVAKTKQPQKYLKDVLGEVCVVTKTGENRNKWSLMEKYHVASSVKPEDGK